MLMGYYKDVTCPRCGGAKFLDVEYSAEYGKWLQECCPECSGLGVVSKWVEEDYTAWW
jgi:DnaJ-class molecular chaperone